MTSDAKKEIKQLAEMMATLNIEHLKFQDIEMSLNANAFNRTEDAGAIVDKHEKLYGEVPSKKPIFGETQEDDMEDVLFHSA